MELRQFRYFVTVAEEGNVTRAAERLGMQQPPLSQQIRSIERELGTQLFHRQPRGMALTEAGRALLEEAQAILARVDHAMEAVRHAGRGEQGRLLIGVPPTAPFHPFLPLVIRRFRERWPLVSLTMEECLRAETLRRLAEGGMDVAFLRAPLDEADGVTVWPLLEEPMILALPAAHPANNEGPVALSELAEDPFIIYARQEGPALYEATILACRDAGFSPRIGQEAPRVASALALVAVGLGVTLVPASMQRMAMDGVAFRPLAGAAPPVAHLRLAARRGDAAPALRNFVTLVRREARRFAAGQGVCTPTARG